MGSKFSRRFRKPCTPVGRLTDTDNDEEIPRQTSAEETGSNQSRERESDGNERYVHEEVLVDIETESSSRSSDGIFTLIRIPTLQSAYDPALTAQDSSTIDESPEFGADDSAACSKDAENSLKPMEEPSDRPFVLECYESSEDHASRDVEKNIKPVEEPSSRPFVLECYQSSESYESPKQGLLGISDSPLSIEQSGDQPLSLENDASLNEEHFGISDSPPQERSGNFSGYSLQALDLANYSSGSDSSFEDPKESFSFSTSSIFTGEDSHKESVQTEPMPGTSSGQTHSHGSTRPMKGKMKKFLQNHHLHIRENLGSRVTGARRKTPRSSNIQVDQSPKENITHARRLLTMADVKRKLSFKLEGSKEFDLPTMTLSPGRRGISKSPNPRPPSLAHFLQSLSPPRFLSPPSSSSMHVSSQSSQTSSSSRNSEDVDWGALLYKHLEEYVASGDIPTAAKFTAATSSKEDKSPVKGFGDMTFDLIFEDDPESGVTAQRTYRRPRFEKAPLRHFVPSTPTILEEPAESKSLPLHSSRLSAGSSSSKEPSISVPSGILAKGASNFPPLHEVDSELTNSAPSEETSDNDDLQRRSPEMQPRGEKPPVSDKVKKNEELFRELLRRQSIKRKLSYSPEDLEFD